MILNVDTAIQYVRDLCTGWEMPISDVSGVMSELDGQPTVDVTFHSPDMHGVVQAGLFTRNGGMRFLRIGRLQLSWCVCRNYLTKE